MSCECCGVPIDDAFHSDDVKRSFCCCAAVIMAWKEILIAFCKVLSDRPRPEENRRCLDRSIWSWVRKCDLQDMNQEAAGCVRRTGKGQAGALCQYRQSVGYSSIGQPLLLL